MVTVWSVLMLASAVVALTLATGLTVAAWGGRRDGLRVRLLEMSQALEPTAHTLLAMLPPLVRLGRKEDVQALSRSLVETDAANARRLNTLKKENDALKRQVAELTRRLAKPG